jgi:hypothetical protein
MCREQALKVVLVLVGLLFVAAVYPIVGGILHPEQSDTGDTMMMSLYATRQNTACCRPLADAGSCGSRQKARTMALTVRS